VRHVACARPFSSVPVREHAAPRAYCATVPSGVPFRGRAAPRACCASDTAHTHECGRGSLLDIFASAPARASGSFRATRVRTGLCARGFARNMRGHTRGGAAASDHGSFYSKPANTAAGVQWSLGSFPWRCPLRFSRRSDSWAVKALSLVTVWPTNKTEPLWRRGLRMAGQGGAFH